MVLDFLVSIARKLVGLDVHGVPVTIIGVHGGKGDASQSAVQGNLVPGIERHVDAVHCRGAIRTVTDLNAGDGLHHESVIDVLRGGDVLQGVVEEEAQSDGGRTLVAVVADCIPEVKAIEIPPTGLHVLVQRQGPRQDGVAGAIGRTQPHVE